MLPLRRDLSLAIVWGCLWTQAVAMLAQDQHPIVDETGAPDLHTQAVSNRLFSFLERQSRLADIAYCVRTAGIGITKPFSCASRCNEFPTLRLVTTFNTGILSTDSSGYVAVDHGEEEQNGRGSTQAIIVAFRGTHSITNTVLDLGTVPQEYVPYPDPDDDNQDEETASEPHHHRCTNCTVHMGFLASWHSARLLVLPALKSARAEHPDYPIHLVGHSLGGAVAALAALELKVALRWDKIKVTTFGEPRVGNQGLVDFIDKEFGMESDDGYDRDLEKRSYQRVTHIHDPVPLLPLTEWGYHSHAGEIFVSKADLSPAPKDLRMCRGDNDASCIAGEEESGDLALVASMIRRAAAETDADDITPENLAGIPSRFKLWELLFAHRDYFWRIGLCVPGGDPADWGRERYNYSQTRNEL